MSLTTIPTLYNFRRNVNLTWELEYTEETIRIPNTEPYVVKLLEVPDNGKIKERPKIDGFFEYFNDKGEYIAPINPNSYWINYNIGYIIFNEANKNQEIIIKYWKKGSLIQAEHINDIVNYINNMSSGLTNEGTFITKVAGENLGGNRIVILENEKVYYANSDNIMHSNLVLGITTHSANLNENVSIQTYGKMTELSWNWELNKNLFLDLNGLMTINKPNYSFCLKIGNVLSSTEIFIKLGIPILN